MKYPVTKEIPYEQIGNGALVLLLLRKFKTWEELCGRYAYADPKESMNTNTMGLVEKLFQMRQQGLISFEDKEAEGGMLPVGEIKDTGLWSKIRVVFGGMSLSEAAMLSRQSTGMAVVPVFGRPRSAKETIDVFVLMPFESKMKTVYTNHIKKMCEGLGLTIGRADDAFMVAPFMEKVWNGICGAQLILADCTDRNPNVFYEIGMAHTVGKKVVLLTRSEDDIPSDIKHWDYIHYVYDPEGVEDLIAKLKTFIKAHFGL